MGRYLIALSILAGCAPVEAVLSVPTFDTDVTESDTDTDADSDADADADADADSDTEPPAPLTWTGTRDFDFGRYCQDTVTEQGVEITNDDAYTDVTGTCGDCSAIFELQVDPDAICDGTVAITTTTYRGIKWLDGGKVTIYLISNDQSPGWYREELATGDVQGSSVTYDYTKDYNGFEYHVNGKATIE
jgi:hypothetical protein